MFYSFLADLVVLLHFLFVLYVVLGALLAIKWPKTLYLHVLALCWGAYIEFSGTICPLTPLENQLRMQGQESGYEGGFIAHYILPVVYPEGLTRSDQMVLGFVLLVLNVFIYGVVIYKWRQTNA